MAELYNAGSGNDAPLTGTYTSIPADHAISFGVDGQADTNFILPTNQDWVLIEVFNIENAGLNVRGYTHWTNNVKDIPSLLIAAQNTVDNDPAISSYDIAALHFKVANSKVDEYKGDEVTALASNSTNRNFSVPVSNWLIDDTPLSDTLPKFEMYIEAQDAGQYINLYVTGGTVEVWDEDLNEQVTLFSGAIPPKTGPRRYTVYSYDAITRIYFGQSDKLTRVDMTVGNTLTSLDSFVLNQSTLSTFTWNGACNATTAVYAFSGCGLSTFPYMEFPSLTQAPYAWANCPNLTTFPAISLPALINGNFCWQNCDGLLSFPFLSLPNLLYGESIWGHSANLVSHGGFSAPNLVGAPGAFQLNGSLESIGPITINNTAGTDISYFFSTCSNLVCLHSLNTINATDTFGLFQGCTSLTSPNASEQTALLAGSNYVNPGSCP